MGGMVSTRFRWLVVMVVALANVGLLVCHVANAQEPSFDRVELFDVCSLTGGGDSSADPATTYSGADVDYQIAARFAPVFHQALGATPRFDYITRFNFDGDWRGDNNWENASNVQYSLSAAVYFNVNESVTHYFIHYAVFHPRDYKGAGVLAQWLSNIFRWFARSPALAHENDMEGALVVVEKPSGLFGSQKVVYVETMAHNDFLRYEIDRLVIDADNSGTAQASRFGRSTDRYYREGSYRLPVEDEHPVLYVEPKGHGIRAFHGGRQIHNVDGFVVYRYTGHAGEPLGVVSGHGQHEDVGYELVPLINTLWLLAQEQHADVYAGTFDYGDWTIRTQDASGVVRRHDKFVGEISDHFRGSAGPGNIARPPWAWHDQGRQGNWFLTPAEMIKRHFELNDTFSTTYLHHPAFGIYRGGSPY